jgi:hypothetical protein
LGSSMLPIVSHPGCAPGGMASNLGYNGKELAPRARSTPRMDALKAAAWSRALRVRACAPPADLPPTGANGVNKVMWSKLLRPLAPACDNLQARVD